MPKAELTGRLQAKIMKHGTPYKSAPLPDDLSFGKVGNCFDECVMAAFRSKGKYQYVEGIATNPDNPYQWQLHAWVTDGKHAYDVTWRYVDQNDRDIRMELPTAYIGIPMELPKVIAYMFKTGNQGIIANRKLEPEDAKAIIGWL